MRTLQIQGQGYEKKKKKKKNWHRLFLRSHTLNKVIYPKQYKKHVLLLSLGRLGCQGSNENFNTFAKVSVLLREVFSYFQGHFFSFLLFLHCRVSSKNLIDTKVKNTVGLFQTLGILGIYNFAHTLK